jgi:dihydrofolate reductase
MKISLIVAMSSNRTIGINGKMPWHLSADLQRFKKLTLGSVVLMGRKTYASIGHPLPGRINIIISHNPAYQVAGSLVFNNTEQALAYCANFKEVFVIGGATLYKALLPRADFIYLTEIHKHFDGDTFFPELDVDNWRKVENIFVNDDKSVDFSYSYIKMVRSNAQA